MKTVGGRGQPGSELGLAGRPGRWTLPPRVGPAGERLVVETVRQTGEPISWHVCQGPSVLVSEILAPIFAGWAGEGTVAGWNGRGTAGHAKGMVVPGSDELAATVVP